MLSHPFVLFSQVKAEESFTPASEDDTVKQLLAEPKNEHVSVDGILHFDGEIPDNAEKCFGLEEIPCGYEYLLNTYRGNSKKKCFSFLSSVHPFCGPPSLVGLENRI